MSEPVPPVTENAICRKCSFASKGGRCQNALNENYARPMWAIQSCTYADKKWEKRA